LFSDWQRELNRVPIRFATLYIQLLLWLCTLSPIVLISISWLLCYILWLWLWLCDMTSVMPLWLCDCHVIFPMLHLSNNLKKKKRNINIDLAVLLSYDIQFYYVCQNNPFYLIRSHKLLCKLFQSSFFHLVFQIFHA